MKKTLESPYLKLSFLLLFAFAFLFTTPPAHSFASAPALIKNLDLKVFEGSYQLLGNQNTFIKISVYSDRLLLKELWSNREINFTQKSDLNFVAADIPDFTLDFTRDKNGDITQAVAFK